MKRMRREIAVFIAGLFLAWQEPLASPLPRPTPKGLASSVSQELLPKPQSRSFEAKREDALYLSPPGPIGEKEVLYFLRRSKPALVVLNWGSDEGLAVGTVLKSLRPQAPLAITTGELKVVKVDDEQAIAQVVRDGTELSAQTFPEFSGVMAGDRVELPRYLFSRRQQVTPESTLFYHALFSDPKTSPSSYELTPEGREALQAAAAKVGGKRVSRLLVKAYTDEHGPAAVNQVESYQRALTVRQFLIEDLGFDPERVVALGFGEESPLDPSHRPGSAERNRRIVLQVITPPSL